MEGIIHKELIKIINNSNFWIKDASLKFMKTIIISELHNSHALTTEPKLIL